MSETTKMTERETTLALIGRCAAGGELTGEALRLFRLGQYGAAREIATQQIARQETGR